MSSLIHPLKDSMIPEEDQNRIIEEELKTVENADSCEKNTQLVVSQVAVLDNPVLSLADQVVVAVAVTVVQTSEDNHRDVELVTRAVVPQQVTKVYNFGSSEMDQFWLPDQRSETRRPYLNAFLNDIVVSQIACGSLHVLILSNQGLVYSSGQNDDGALGRIDESASDEESDKKSKLVELPLRVNMISAGDSHSVAANSVLGICFQWGTYRNTEKSNLAPPAKSPVRVGVKEFAKKTFAKILSGQQHTLVLTSEGDLFGWGDPDMGVVGRMPKTRHGYEQALKVAKITQHKAVDIYTGGRHSFMKRLIKKGLPANANVEEQKPVFAYFAWGLNNFGQLGLDLPEEKHQDVVFEPMQMRFFDNLDVKTFCGGESHSIALLQNGQVYAFGRNDIGQFGLGKEKDIHSILGEIKEINPKPLEIDTFPKHAKKIIKIWAGSNYCYGQDDSGQCFSWGFGCNFVLGNRKDMDEDEYIPFTVPLDFFKNEIPTEFALGSQHVSYFVNLPVDSNPSTVSRELLLNVPEEFLPIHMRVKTAATALARVQAEKEERIAKKSEETLKKKEEEALKKAEKEKEKALKKEEKVEQIDKIIAQNNNGDDKKRQSSISKRPSSISKKPKANNRNSNSKSPLPVSQNKSKQTSKKSTSESASTQKVNTKPTTSSSNKKKVSQEDQVKVSEVKKSKQLKDKSLSKK